MINLCASNLRAEYSTFQSGNGGANPTLALHFNSAWRAATLIEPCSVSDVDCLIKAHYLRKRPAIVVLCLRMLVGSALVGTVVYSLPPRESSVRYGGKTWELARLYLLNDVPRNAESWLISQSVRHIRKQNPDIKFLVSYADPSAGHSGTIYKAANWRADGRTDQGRKTPRCDYVDARTGKKYGRRGNVPADATVTRVPRISKWRFVLAL